MPGDERRPFHGPSSDRARQDRGGYGAERTGGERQASDRPGFAGPRPFVRPPTRGGEVTPLAHSLRLRDGDREIEVSGGPAFVRQVLDDLPTLLARLRGEAASRSSLAMPPPPSRPAPPIEQPVPAASPGNGRAAPGQPNAAAHELLEQRIFSLLGASSGPLPVAAIRAQLGDAVTGQQLRRVLERAHDKVIASQERPVTYTLR